MALEILLALADEDRHGYGVMLEVERRTQGAVKLRPGTLYRAIGRLVASGLIEEVSDGGAGHRDPRRRYYHLTDLGRRVTAAEARRLTNIVEAARAKKLLRPEKA